MDGFKVKIAGLPRTIEGLGSIGKGMMGRVRDVLNTHGHEMVGGVKGNLTGRKLKVRSGRLRSAVRKSVSIKGTLFGLSVGVLDRIKYAAMHEKEGYTVIKPKRVNWLTIPVGPALTPSGVQRFTARQLTESRVIPSRKPGTLLMQIPKGKKGLWVTVFILKKRVVIYGKPYIRPAVKQDMPALVRDLGNAIINKEAAA